MHLLKLILPRMSNISIQSIRVPVACRYHCQCRYIMIVSCAIVTRVLCFPPRAIITNTHTTGITVMMTTIG
jgi:hypothetical protein